MGARISQVPVPDPERRCGAFPAASSLPCLALLSMGALQIDEHISHLSWSRAACGDGFCAWARRVCDPCWSFIDNSVIPIPGGMDIFVIASDRSSPQLVDRLCAGRDGSRRHAWRIPHVSPREKGECAEGLEKKIGAGRRCRKKVYRRFAKGSFSTVQWWRSMIPPPFPLVPVLMAAGILRYSRRKFLT